MDKDMSDQLDRVKELVDDLEKEFNKILVSQEISGRAKNITHEIIEKLSNILDQVARKLWEKFIFPNLNSEERKRARVYFPIARDKNSFDSILGRSAKDFESKYPDLYAYFLSKQSFTTNDNWITTLRDIAGEKHIGLIPQRLTEVTHMTIASNAGTVHLISEQVKFGPGVAILGAPIDPSTQRIIPTEGVKETVEKWVSFVIDKYEVDALSFCKGSYENVKSLIEEVQKEFGIQ